MKKKTRTKNTKTKEKAISNEQLTLILLAIAIGAFLIAAAVIGIVSVVRSTGREESSSSVEKESEEGGRTDVFVPEEYETEGDFRYTVVGNTASVYQYIGTDMRVTVPDTLGGYVVTELSEYSFYNELSEVTLPQSITAIGEEAFVTSNRLTIHFLGTTDEWNAIFIDPINSVLDEATVICTDTKS